MLSFIIFNANNMTEACRNIIGLFGTNGENFINNYTIYYLKNYFVVLIIAIIGATPLLKNAIEKLRKKELFKKYRNRTNRRSRYIRQIRRRKRNS